MLEHALHAPEAAAGQHHDLGRALSGRRIDGGRRHDLRAFGGGREIAEAEGRQQQHEAADAEGRDPHRL
jgi:hypothetical protein